MARRAASGRAATRAGKYPAMLCNHRPRPDVFIATTVRTGWVEKGTSSLNEEVTTSGVVTHLLATGFTSRDHSSFDAIEHWVLYLSGTDLFISQNGQRPEPMILGMKAAAWVPPGPGPAK
jgi:hypothetical protein